MRNHIAIWIFVLVTFGTMNALAQVCNTEEEKPIGREYRLNVRNSGSPFFVDTWVNARIDFTSGKTKNSVQIKYDGYIDELICLSQNRRALIQIEKSTIDNFSFLLEGRSYVFVRRSLDGENDEDHFFQVLYRGNIDFLCWRKMELASDQAGASGKMVYNRAPQFYLQYGNGNFQLINLSKRSFLHLIKKDKLRMAKKIIRSNNLKFKSTEQFSNSLDFVDNNFADFWED